MNILEDYPSPAEGNGLENRQACKSVRGFESHILLIVKEKTLKLPSIEKSVPRRRAMLVRGSLKSLERKLFVLSGNL